MLTFGNASNYGLENHGLRNLGNVYWNLSPALLVEHVVIRGEGQLSPDGAVMVNTGQHTGRSPNDKYVVRTGTSLDEKIWWGKVNQPLSPDKFNQLYYKCIAYLQGRDIYVQDMQAGAHSGYNLPIRVISEKAWASLFAHNLLIRLPAEQLVNHKPDFTVIHCPELQADPKTDGVVSGTFIILNFEQRVILIGGSAYAGEIKKSIFSVMNYLLPLRGVLSMHCSANVGTDGDVALFFGLSGTGKTTLSSDPERYLIGDDEHGWSDNGVFNVEGGCYAKTIRLDPKLEPIIWAATHRFGAVLENVVYDPKTRIIDFNNESLTENTRGAYPITSVPNHISEGYAGHPVNIFFLTADAFGVLPPLARLTPEQAMYYFLSGYTSKLAGTERGLGAEPQATFSACFGAPFLPLHPNTYAELLGQKIAKHQATVWLVNTGWTGGPYGVGSRFKLPYTRAMIRAALTHQLDDVQFNQDTHFGLWIPSSCPDVPAEVLNPQNTWQDKKAYDQQAQGLVNRFEKNFAQFSDAVSAAVMAAGPHSR
jgi:phosphoenolpyruvate carboxykinase (ATP)